MSNNSDVSEFLDRYLPFSTAFSKADTAFFFFWFVYGVTPIERNS